MTLPAQKPGKSRQDYQTPPEFIEAVERKFGPLAVDLAASDTNRVAPIWLTKEEDALSKASWAFLLPEGNCWLNPPFADIEPWVKMCAETAAWAASPILERFALLLLVPASVGSVWFSRYVHGKAYVLALQPRLTFVGETAPYPKDCILAVYGWPPGFDVWRWDGKGARS